MAADLEKLARQLEIEGHTLGAKAARQSAELWLEAGIIPPKLEYSPIQAPTRPRRGRGSTETVEIAGRVVFDRLKTQDKTLTQLAQEAGISKGYASLIQRGKVEKVSSKVVQGLANALGIDKSELIPSQQK